jgi:hypothetical protein
MHSSETRSLESQICDDFHHRTNQSRNTTMNGTAAPSSLCPPEQLLEQLTVEYSRGESCYRKHLLSCGRLAHAYVLTRKREGASRESATQTIAGRLAALSGKKVDVNCLIGTAQAVDLLAAGTDYSAVPFRVLRELRPLVMRNKKSEAWSIRPGLEEGARQLFQQVVENHLDADGAKERVRELLGKEPPTRGPKGDECDDPLAFLVDADPRDAAEMLAPVFKQHNDPAGLGTALAQAMLEVGAHRALNALALVLLQRERQAEQDVA